MAWRLASRCGFLHAAARPGLALKQSFGTTCAPVARHHRQLVLGSSLAAAAWATYFQPWPKQVILAEELSQAKLSASHVAHQADATEGSKSTVVGRSETSVSQSCCQDVVDDGELQLVKMAEVKRGSRIAGFLAWSVVMFCWTSLVWLPLLTAALVADVIRSGPSTGVCSALSCLACLYAFPYIFSPSGLDKSGNWCRWQMGWFESVEVWAAQEAMERPVTEPTLICYHPHGVFCVGITAIALAGKRLLRDGADAFISPYINYACPLMAMMANVCWPIPVRFHSVGKNSMHRVLQERHDTVLIVPGGIQEATLSKPGQQLVFLERRKGFVKYALQLGYSLTPVYTFGETDTYGNLQAGMKWRLKLNQGFLGQPQGIPTVCPFGWTWCPVLPRPGANLRVVVGPPLKLPHIKNPTNEDVQRWHAAYVQALKSVHVAGMKGRSDAHPLKVM